MKITINTEDASDIKLMEDIKESVNILIKTDYISSEGLGKISYILELAKRKGVETKILIENKFVFDILELVGLTTVYNCLLLNNA